MPVPDSFLVEPNKSKQYFPIPADKYQVMIYDVNYIKELDFKGEKEVDKLEFTFVVLDDKKTKSVDENGEPIEESTRGRRLWRKIPRSFSPGGKFRASLFFELMCAINRKQLEKEELTAVQPNTLIGKQLCLFVSVNDQWNNIESFLAATGDLEPMNTVLDEEPKKETAASEGEKPSEEPKVEDANDLPF